MKKILWIMAFLLLNACAGSEPLQVARGLLGYIPPPEETTIGQELQLEFERCKKIDEEKNCAQAAFDVVRTVKGLEPRKVPKGIVIILQGDGSQYSEAEKQKMIDEALKKAEQAENNSEK